MNDFFTVFAYQPVYNLIIFLSGIFPVANFGMAIIFATLFIKLVFLPLSRKQIESQKKLQELQPKMKVIQEKYKDDKERQSREIMDLYKKNDVNPVMGCLPLLVQVVFLITIYHVIIRISESGFSVDQESLYAFVSIPTALSREFFGIASLDTPSVLFASLAALGQFYQMKMLSPAKTDEGKTGKGSVEGKDPDFATIMNKQMLYVGPILTLFIGIRFPSALSLYWLVSTVFSIIQQWSLFKKRKEAGGAVS